MCWCDSSIRTPCCGKPECFPKEGKSKIQIIKQQIENLQKELKTEQDNCLHQNVMYETGANTGNYDPSSDCYWNHVPPAEVPILLLEQFGLKIPH